MKKTITAVLTFMFLQTSMFGWHESFSNETTPDLTGTVVSDMTWVWWGWGGVQVTDGAIVLTEPDPGTDPFDLNTCWIQIDQSVDANAEITPTAAEIWIKIKISTTGTWDEDDQFHVAVAIDPDFLTNFGVYTCAVVPAANMVGGYFFQTDDFQPGSNPAIVYDSYFWEKITVVDDTVSIYTFADGDTPSDTPDMVYATDGVAAPAPTLILVAKLADDSSSVSISEVYYNESPLGIEDNPYIVSGFELNQNYPNPFNPVTRISYTVPVTCQVKLSVFNVLGEEVSTLVNNVVTSGKHTATWNASNMPSGVYFYSIEAGGFTQTKKLLLIK